MNRISLIPIKFKLANSPATTEIVSKLHLATVAKLLSELEHEFSKAIVAIFSDLCKKWKFSKVIYVSNWVNRQILSEDERIESYVRNLCPVNETWIWCNLKMTCKLNGTTRFWTADCCLCDTDHRQR